MDFPRALADPILTAPTPGLQALAGGLNRGTAASDAESDPTRRAALQFEAVFLSQMMAPMFESVDGGELFGSGQSERIYRSMMVQEYGKAIVRSGGLGLADAVQREMIKLQEMQS